LGVAEGKNIMRESKPPFRDQAILTVKTLAGAVLIVAYLCFLDARTSPVDLRNASTNRKRRYLAPLILKLSS